MDEQPIRFGIIGAVRRGGSFANGLQANPATAIAALCDVAEEELAGSAARLGVERTFTDAEAMLDSGLVDAVVIGTPMPFHAPQAIMALERGIHVLSEVTAGVSLEECEELVRAVPAQQRRLHDGGKTTPTRSRTSSSGRSPAAACSASSTTPKGPTYTSSSSSTRSPGGGGAGRPGSTPAPTPPTASVRCCSGSNRTG